VANCPGVCLEALSKVVKLFDYCNCEKRQLNTQSMPRFTVDRKQKTDRTIEVSVCIVTQCDAIRCMPGNVTSSRTFLGAKCASNHPHKCDDLKLEIAMYLT